MYQGNENFAIRGNVLRVKDCSGSNMQLLVELFNYLSFTELHFINSNIKDSDAQNLKGINKGINRDYRLHFYNCPNITDQGVTILTKNTNPNCLTVLHCPNITDECIQKCKNIINAEPKPKPEKPKPKPKPEPKPAKPKPEPVPKPKPASSINELTTQCASKGERNSIYLQR